MQQFAPADIERTRTRFDVIAADIALRRAGRELVGLCPFHKEKTPSFAIVASKGFAHCQGCGWHGTAIDYVMQRRNLDFVAAVRVLLNLPEQTPKRDRAIRRTAPRADDDGSAAARAIWDKSGPPERYVVTYFWSRYLPADRISPAIREHPALLYAVPVDGPGQETPPWRRWRHLDREGHAQWFRGRRFPALIAAFHNSRDELSAVQRIWLEGSSFEVDAEGGNPKGTRIKEDAPKKSLGVLGDGAVRLAPAGPVLGFGEGVETALAAARLYRTPVWALGGLSRLGYPAHWSMPQNGSKPCWVEARPPSVWVPDEVRHLFVFGDGNEIGRLVAEFAAEWWRWKWRGTGRAAEAVLPELGYGDFQDKLRTATLAGAIR